MNKITSFLNNNSMLLFSWLCTLFYYIVSFIGEGIFFKTSRAPHSYSICVTVFCYVLVVFLLFSIFYSFYQSIRNININKTYAFALLILYLVFWIFLPYGLIDDSMDGINNIDNIDKGDIIRLFIFIFTNICILLFHKFKKESRIMIPCLLFYSFNFLLILIFLLMCTVHDL